MKKKIRYKEERLGRLKVVPDFLPSPGELVFRKEDNVKVTLSLSRASIDFFKREASKRRTPYQKMIRRLLDIYAEQHNRNN
jgi:hypothetical protein